MALTFNVLHTPL